jgi:hypothetical protein
MNRKHASNRETKIFIQDKDINKLLQLCIRISMPFLSIWYNLLLVIALLKKAKTDKKYYFSICAIFKDESLSLKEWVEYHRIIGVDHFYLYNNQSSDNYKEILQPFIDKGIVTLIEWDINPPSQIPAYQNFHDNYWDETNWVAFIDLDEYICPKRAESITMWIKRYEKFPSLVLYWKQFGSSGQIAHNHSKLIIEQYTTSWDKFYDQGKPIFNTAFDVYAFSPKYVHVLPASISILNHKFLIPPINEFRKFIRFRCNRIGIFKGKQHFSIQINHYATKSYKEFFINKRKRGAPTNTGKNAQHIRSSFAYNFVQNYATTCDYTIHRFLLKLKVKLNDNIEDFYN